MRYCMPPDPNPRRPLFAPPPKACDAHFHVFGPPEEFPFAPTREYTPPAAPLEHYLQLAAFLGIERGVVVQPSVHGFDNSVTLAAVARSADRFRAVVRAKLETSRAELERLHEKGARGVRFNLLERPRGNAPFDTIAAVAERVAPLGWSLDLHIDPPNLLRYAERIRALPGPVVIDHLARIEPVAGLRQPAFQLLLELLADRRFWVKISGVDKICGTSVRAYHGLPYVEVAPFAGAAFEAAPDRTIWGSDWPHSNIFAPGFTPNDGDLLDLLLAFFPDEASRRKILVENPARLYFEGA